MLQLIACKYFARKYNPKGLTYGCCEGTQVACVEIYNLDFSIRNAQQCTELFER